jgi:ubiquinone/menaquinone biosynthesis C-methylase UbiE
MCLQKETKPQGFPPEELANRILALFSHLHAESDLFRRLSEPHVETMFLRNEMELPEVEGSFTPEELIRGLPRFNEASEHYFAQYQAQSRLMNKPFSEIEFSKRLFDLGVLIHWLRISPGDIVAEIGSGTCWLSHLLNRFGCKTIAVDVSATALAMGRELFDKDPNTNWDLEPEFLTYDGHHLPLEDGGCDKIIIYDAFHHFPNQEELLSEMARVLRSGGIVGMCEPGRRHSRSAASREEMEKTGVLENDIIVEELKRLAEGCGFNELTVVPVSLPETIEVPADALAKFMKGKALRHYWTKLCQGIQTEHYILMYKGDYLPTTRRPENLRAEIWINEPQRQITTPRGQILSLECSIKNCGDTLWLAQPPWLDEVHQRLGWTRFGAHLYRMDAEAVLMDHEWLRVDLPGDVLPGREITLKLKLPPLETPGNYRVVFDLVIENMLWFAHNDSPTAQIDLLVES